MKKIVFPACNFKWNENPRQEFLNSRFFYLATFELLSISSQQDIITLEDSEKYYLSLVIG